MTFDLPLYCALCSVVLLVLGAMLAAVASQFEPVEPTFAPDYLFNGFRLRPLAMELARNQEEIRRILGAHNQRNRVIMRRVQWLSFVVTAAWWLLSVLTASVMWDEDFPEHKILAGVVFTLGSFAAYYDGHSNIRILRILYTPLLMSSTATVNLLAGEGRAAALLKWILLFAAMILTAPLFFVFALRSEHGWWYWAPGCMLIVTGIRGYSTLWRGGKLEYALNYIPPTIAVLAVAFVAKSALK